MSYWKPTPKKMRILGDSLLALSTAIATTAGLMSYPKIAIIAGVAGALGKFLTNFASITEKK